MLTTKKLKFMPYAQAQVRVYGDEFCIELISYKTVVARLYAGSWLRIYGLYSMTTRRHIKAFCKEYCGFDNFSLIKTLATQKVDYDIHTGEIIDTSNLEL